MYQYDTADPPSDDVCRSNSAGPDRSLLLSFLVMLRDEGIQQPHAPAGTPALVRVVAAAVHRGTGEIDVAPGRVLLDEALQEGCRGCGTRPAPASVLHVGVLGIHHLVECLVERHAPDFFAGRA